MHNISVIIPTYNRKNQLGKCLVSLKDQDYPRENFEVIVVDDGSNEELFPLVSVFKERLNIILIKQGHTGISQARNTGIRSARYEIIVFLEDDCIVSLDWLRNIDMAFRNYPSMQILQFRIESEGRGFFEILNQEYLNTFITFSLFFPFKSGIIKKIKFFLKRNPTAYTLNTKANLLPLFRAAAFKRNVFGEVGLFSVKLSYAEDREMAYRILAKGINAVYYGSIVVKHRHPDTLALSLMKQFNYGRASVDLKRNSSDYPFYFGDSFLHSFIFCAARLFFYPLWKACQLPLAKMVLFLPFFFLLNIAYIQGVFYESGNCTRFPKPIRWC